ncbi:MAG: hypothetical protein FJ335_09575, partial [Sphingomonadales bacterium]|nr:hypothetical protein [Sphingomonadales bacterium]
MKSVYSIVAVATACVSGGASAQQVEDAVQDDRDAQTVVVTGDRFGGRTATDSPVPVDSIAREQLQQNGRVDLIQ